MKIEIYGRTNPYCASCEGAKTFLDIRKKEYTFLDISDPENRTAMFQKAPVGITTVPQIFIDGTWVGGFDKLKEYFSEEKAI